MKSKVLFTISALLLSAFGLCSQQIESTTINSAGTSLTNNDLVLEYSFGESFIEEYQASGFSLELGVIQVENNLSLDDTLPDLVIDSITIDKTEFKPGDQFIAVNASVKNKGLLGTDALFRSRLYLSQDTIVDQGLDLEMATSFTFGLAVDSCDNLLFFAEIPDTINPGDWFFLISADDDAEVEESNDSNNVGIIAIRIIDIAVDGPDLVVDSIQVDKTELFPGEQFIRIEALIRNDGFTSVDGLFNNRIYLSDDNLVDTSDIELASSGVFNLEPDSSASINRLINIPEAILPGDKFLIISADDDQDIPEIDETNNLGLIPIRILDISVDGPDLVVDSIQVDKTELFPGEQSVRVEALIRNGGLTSADGLFTNRIYLSDDNLVDTSDTELASGLVFNLEPDSSASINRTINIPEAILPGDKFFIISADDDQDIPEIDETNNLGLIPIRILDIATTAPDLEFVDVQPSKALYFAGDNVRWELMVTNSGFSNSPRSFGNIVLSTDTILDPMEDTGVGFFTVDSLKPGEIDTLNASFAIPGETLPDEYTLFLCLDRLDLITEVDEINNCLGNKIVVGDPSLRPDLAIFDFDAFSTEYFPGDRDLFTLRVDNLGGTSVDPIFVRTFLTTADTLNIDLAIPIGLSLTPEIKSDSSVTFRASVPIPDTTAPGNYSIFAVADIFDRINESNEENNEAQLPITVLDVSLAPDLTITAIDLTGEARVSDTVNFLTEITNLGATVARPSFVTGFITKADSIVSGEAVFLGSTEIEAIESASSNRSFSSVNYAGFIRDTVAPGTWNLFLRADGFGRLAELDEENNELAISIEILDSLGATNIRELSPFDQSIAVMPNPVDHSFELLTEIKVPLKYSIFANDGKWMNTGTYQANNEIVIKEYPAGSYWLIVTDLEGHYKILPIIKS